MYRLFKQRKLSGKNRNVLIVRKYPMARELEADSLQDKGNRIRIFKTTEEVKREKIIKDEVEQVNNIIVKSKEKIVEVASNLLKTRKDILGSGTSDLETGTLNPSIIRESKQEIINNALKIVCENLHAQTAAIFIISKDGALERVGMYEFGKDEKDSHTLEEFSEESYKFGEGLTGKVIPSQKSSGYGEIQYAPTISDEDFNSDFRTEYLKKFGNLKSAIAIPLNGRNRTCGVLRVINKVDGDASAGMKISLSDDSFSENDVNLLLFLATNISNALSNFRRDMQINMLKYLSHLLIQPFHQKSEIFLSSIFQQILDLLVKNPETAFKACILRVKDETLGSLKVVAKSLADGLTENRDDNPRVQNDDEVLWIIAKSEQRLIIPDVQSVIKDLQENNKPLGLFKNKDWIEKNCFQSFVGFPLVAKGEVVGTLSAYTRYEYDVDSIDFLQGVADLLGSFIFNMKSQKQEHKIQDILLPRSTNLQIEEKFNTLVEEWTRDTKFLSSVIEMSIHPAYQKIIGLGSDVVPFLLRELNKNDDPDHWFWALSAITGENPVALEQQGKLSLMKEAWIQWGKKKNYV